ncbi:diguanylate cyclase domain-containing protein [Aeromonas popoffii]|uniref:diguanylate cyclase domain-containing protein n=1 Tax=Aeromonas popoffii TaxID=70856 RepID=UPI0005A6B9A2
MALALLWITQLQATPSLQEEAEWQAGRDPVGYLRRLDAHPQQDMEELDKALALLSQRKPAVTDHLMPDSGWHALNGLALYRTGHVSVSSKALQARLLADQGRYPEAYHALIDYMREYKQHFNQTPSQHAAAFQAEMELARSEASNHALQQENERQRKQLLHQQSARNYQLVLVGLLASALLLLGITTHRLHRSSRHLYKLATFDQLTDLPNRRALLERLATRWQQEGPLTLLIIDIDHFKQINDRHGHQAGDRAIQLLARELRSWAPDLQLVGRWGGEEFLVAVPLPAEDCWHLAEQLRQRIALLDNPRMTISTGVAGRSPADERLGQLIHRADMAMYQAKRQGRNQTILATIPSAQDELASSVA